MTANPSVAARLASLAAFSCLLAGCDGPAYASDGIRSYACYTTPGEPSVAVEFRDDARTAVVAYAGRRVELAYQGAEGILPFMSRVETYSAYDVLLTLDPEANLTGLTPQGLGPCQSE